MFKRSLFTTVDNIPIKEKLKKRLPWENPDICLKRGNLKAAAQSKNSFMIHTIQSKNSISNRKLMKLKKSAYAWKVVNDITDRKKNNKAKIKATSGEERITLLYTHFKDHPTNKELYGRIPDICTSLRQQRLRFSGHCWRSKQELASKVILWLPTHSKRNRGRKKDIF